MRKTAYGMKLPPKFHYRISEPTANIAPNIRPLCLIRGPDPFKGCREITRETTTIPEPITAPIVKPIPATNTLSFKDPLAMFFSMLAGKSTAPARDFELNPQ
eukprot:TRINITY_DN33001_c0_g1_i2.p2 TRINITY_DN33001_c0_g1~~TRINITY_DN33001_c0_g1_i2.p2  ORF type:complete len:102 (+),score=0.03 TRINITY_DN33001_c0_g1_i2:120-425(+)